MIDFSEIGRLPAPDDNCAIATRLLPAGTAVRLKHVTFSLPYTILEGHRFAIRPIPAGAPLLSWGFPFGLALTDIAAGDYVCNEAVLAELNGRALNFPLPRKPNFADSPGEWASKKKLANSQTRKLADPQLTFQGYPRSGGRGAGTRNTIVLLGVTSLVSGFVQRLAAQLQPLTTRYINIDDIVAVTHTEGNGRHRNNHDLLLRTLAGFVVHPNVGAVLLIDDGGEGATSDSLHRYLAENGYPLAHVRHDFLSLLGSFDATLERAAAIVQGWLPAVNGVARTAVPLSRLKIALQCGGSDAFSGVSGNPLAAWVAREVLQHGGSANLAETDELVGAEAYVLDQVRDAATAGRFLEMVERFQTWAGRHGHSVAGNPSGGNLYRGLYNIYLKSIGAATKRHPGAPLDAVIEYAAPMTGPGFYFMDSPGNDLESVAGQVAAGCNLIFFVTGNGSITNFPFVPTIKIVTTSGRYNLLSAEMDVNAGAYLDGVPLPTLGWQTFDLTLEIASGRPSAGEKAGHAQVQIWRDWRLAGPADGADVDQPARLHGRPHPIGPRSIDHRRWISSEASSIIRCPPSIGLILPTSLCAGQIGLMCARRLNDQGFGQEQGFTRFVALAHTEGCGASTQAEFVNTMLGYARHPLVKCCLLLEHGCEKTHNAFWQRQMIEAGMDPESFGWASIQLDGGIQPVLTKMAAWFRDEGHGEGETRGHGNTRTWRRGVQGSPLLPGSSAPPLLLGLVTDGPVSAAAAGQWARLVHWFVTTGAMVIVPVHDGLLSQATFLEGLGLPVRPAATLAFAQAPAQAGFHIMQTPSDHWAETLTGLGATGMEVVLAPVGTRPLPGHPLVPVLQLGEATVAAVAHAGDLDAILHGDSLAWFNQLWPLLQATLAGVYTPRANQQQNVAFQVTRGVLGISL